MRLLHLAGASLLALALALAAPAWASDDSVTAKNAAGGTTTFCSKDTGGGVMASCSVPVNTSGVKVNPATSDNQTATQANAGSDASKAIAVQGVTGGKAVPTTQTSLAWTASGVSAVTCALTSATTCGTFTPVAGRDFNVSAWGTFVATFQLERSFDAGSNWLPITAAGTQLYQWTAAESEAASESEYGVQYRVRVTSYTSGTLNVRISQ